MGGHKIQTLIDNDHGIGPVLLLSTWVKVMQFDRKRYARAE